ncbi:SDR family oxidoreductase [Actinomyces sp. oral taxon 448]|uniref:SDR family oxidoreductase n=1 Tax=Actinomyces sp. oral taxon 448 TaxID=712124 RepID=UPI0025BFA0AF|nr:SDR family oxidoreductase [Actinomyces sp. oral taxon 448]
MTGRTVVVTGVSRRAGIGHAVACRAADLGASLLCHHFSPHDAEQPWGADSVGATLDSVRGHLVAGARLIDIEADVRDPEAPQAVIEYAVRSFGTVDALVCNQASSGRDGALERITAADLDHHWAVDARASLLLVQAYAEHAAGRYEAEPGGGSDESGGGSEGAGSSGSAVLPGSVVLMTSGQGLGPMPEEIAYCTAKAALAGITPSLAAGLAERGIRLNSVNPGPVDTGYMDYPGCEDDGLRDAVAGMFPRGRIAQPDDPARLICWLLTDDASWVTGQVISTEGGFRR